MCCFSWNLGASTSWKPQGLSRPVIGLHYLFYLLYFPRISYKGLLEECVKEQNLEVTGAVTASCLKRMLCNIVFNVTHSPSHRQTGAHMINIYQLLTLLPICVKMFHLQCYLVAKVIHIQSLRSQILYIYTYSSQYREAGRPKEIKKKKWDSSECRVPRKSFRAP